MTNTFATHLVDTKEKVNLLLLCPCLYVTHTYTSRFTDYKLKVTIFWDIAPCSLVKGDDVSEVCTAFIIKK
jgi:hypothetical protein